MHLYPDKHQVCEHARTGAAWHVCGRVSCAVLCCAGTSGHRHQLGLLVWGLAGCMSEGPSEGLSACSPVCVCVPTAMHACAALPATLPGGRASAAGSAATWECFIQIKGTVCQRRGPWMWRVLSVLFHCATLCDWGTLLCRALSRCVVVGPALVFAVRVLPLLVATACRHRVVGRACFACCALHPAARPSARSSAHANCLLPLDVERGFPLQ